MTDLLSNRRIRRGIATAVAVAVVRLGWPALAHAQTVGRDATREPSGPAGPEERDARDLPVGHAAVGEGSGGVPAGERSSPHASTGGGGRPDIFEPPEDTEREDATLPAGTIVVEIRDADDRPVAGEGVTLGILINSIAKGDSRKHIQGTTDARGMARFSGLETTSNIAYRVSSSHQGGLFAASPFQMEQTKSMRVILHVYPVSHDIQATLVLCEVAVAAELRDDRIQLEEALTIYNLGRVAWQPTDVSISLPHDFTAFNSQPSMSDQGVDVADGSAVLHGTFPPGHQAIQFRWQIPWSNESDVDFVVGVPPHMAIGRVLMPATAGIQLTATGFPPAEIRRDAQGQSFLVSERRMRPDDARVRSLAIGIHNLPTPGPGRNVALFLAALGVATGLWFIGRRTPRRGPPGGPAGPLETRQALLAELGELEDAHTAGEVGPRTYERARRSLIDRISLTLSLP